MCLAGPRTDRLDFSYLFRQGVEAVGYIVQLGKIGLSFFVVLAGVCLNNHTHCLFLGVDVKMHVRNSR